MYVCLCNSITEAEIAQCCKDAVEPIDVFQSCGKQPRCCSCFPHIQGMIDNHPDKIRTLDDLNIQSIQKLKDVIFESLPHIWRERKEDGKIVFFKGQKCVTIGSNEPGAIYIVGVELINLKKLIEWFNVNTRIPTDNLLEGVS